MNVALGGVRLFHIAVGLGYGRLIKARLCTPTEKELSRMQTTVDPRAFERIVYTSSAATLRAAKGSVLVDATMKTAPLAEEGIGSYKKSKVLAERLVERMVA
jgi:dihydroflavonol-4-reductase